MNAVIGLALIAICVVLIRIARPRTDGSSRPRFMEVAGMEAAIAMVCTTLGAIGIGLAADGAISLFG